MTWVLRQLVFFFGLVLSISGGQVAKADTALMLNWQDLIPKRAPFNDPFAKLTPPQMRDLGLVARLRLQVSRGPELSDDSKGDLVAAEEKLRRQGIDIEGLLAQRLAVAEKRSKAARALNERIVDMRVRLAGYLLPLEFDGTLVTEFLLVPFVGACIHVPPPTPNQIVHVKYNKGFVAKGLFAPVWIQGVLKAGFSKKNLHLVDGSANVGVGYSMAASVVKNHR